MNTVDQVLQLLNDNAEPLRPRAVALEESLGCVLAADAAADADQPAFDRSAIDGFALLQGSRAGGYSVCGEILPGDPTPPAPPTGQALRVFTGSAVPAGCSLVMLEDTETDGSRVIVRADASDNLIRRRGGSIRAGTVLLGNGTRLGAGEIAVLASAGVSHPQVVPRPRVLHLTTGREIIPFGAQPAQGQVRDTNGPLIGALLREAGVITVPRRHVDESIAALLEAAQGGDEWDLLLVSGGSSVGKHDRTREALEALGFSVLVQRVNSRPGKPLIIARRGLQWALGLPGNPVSHFVTFHVFVVRLLRRLAGIDAADFVSARLAADLPPGTDPRETFWPSRLSPTPQGALEVRPLPWLDSGDIKALGGVNALIRVPGGATLSTGGIVSVVSCTPFPSSTP